MTTYRFIIFLTNMIRKNKFHCQNLAPKKVLEEKEEEEMYLVMIITRNKFNLNEEKN